jgi:hypothetical protein
MLSSGGGNSMPRLVKGGKHVYGWSEVGKDGKIVVPTEALADYNIQLPCKVILLSGSSRSGGFAITTLSLLKNSALFRILENNPKLANFELAEGEIILISGKPCCWVMLDTNGYIVVPLQSLKKFDVTTGNLLLSVRGSRLGLGFCAKGPLIEEAKRHPSLILFK